MALTGKQLEIETPCPIDLDRSLSDGSTRAWDCGHCSKTVHVLSSMTEREARNFLRKHEGETLCITYLEADNGEIRFQPERDVVPMARLTRGVRQRPAAAAAVMGFAAALAACTPTENDAVRPQAPVQMESTKVEAEPESKTSMADLIAEAREKAAEPTPEPTPEPVIEEPTPDPEPIRDPSAIPRPGGLRVPHIAPPTPVPPTTVTAEIEEAPCDPPETTTAPVAITAPSTMKRGGIGVRVH